MSVYQDILANGHVAHELLRDFAERPDDFDDDTVEAIWKHLDVCEACIDDYEAIREGRLEENIEKGAEEPPPPNPAPTSSFDATAFDPDDLSNAKIKNTENDGEHINGLIPVGDDPSRNGVLKEHSDEKPAEASDETGRDEETEEEPPKVKAPVIEGLITGKVSPIEDPVDSLETESALEAGRRLAREKLKTADEPEDSESSQTDEESKEDTDETDARDTDDDLTDAAEDEVADGVAEVAEEEVSSADESDAAEEAPRPTHSRPTVSVEQTVEAPPDGERSQTATKPSRSARPSRPDATAAKPDRPRAGAIPPGARTSKPEPLEELFNKLGAFFARPRNAIIYGAALVLIAGAFVLSFRITEKQESSPIAGWAPLNVIETRAPLQEVLVRRIRRGRIPPASGTDVTLDFRRIDELVIAVDLDFIRGNAKAYEVVVRDPARTVIFQEEIPQFFLDEGRLFLRLVPKQFETGQLYQLDLVAHRADGSLLVIAESVFDVVK